MLRASVYLLSAMLLLAGPVTVQAGAKGKKMTALDFKMTNLAGKEVDLGQYRGKVVLFVNVASECGYTPQYKGLQELHKKYAKDGLVVIGVPSNEFGGQEPGTNAQIAEFCKKNYGVEFLVLGKVMVTGKEACPLYQYLTSEKTNAKKPGAVRWNFEKFIIGRDGSIVARFASDTEPDSDEFLRALQQALKQ